MSASLTLANADHLDALLKLIAAFHSESGLQTTDEKRRAAIEPLTNGIPHGAAYLIGPPRAPIGYVIISFGWSVEMGGLDGFLDEIYIRPTVRGRGIATEALIALSKAMAQAGVKALHLEVDQANADAVKLYEKIGFRVREKYHLMTREL